VDCNFLFCLMVSAAGAVDLAVNDLAIDDLAVLLA
jgi:hypothetical protein